jgi:pyruvate/2-oxoglutarate dehydrogenase complex dihydrolipoamide acyltransferase (E2) component
VATTTVAIPKLSQAVTEGILTAWMVEDGATVTAGQILYRLETEKVEMDIEAPVAGVIHLSGQPGETYAVGTEIATIESA